MKAGTALDEAYQKELASALEKYPFFAMGRMMMAKVATKLGDPRAQQLRFLGALYAPSRQHYAFFLEEKMRPRVPPPPRLTPAGREPQTPSARNEQKDDKTPSGEEPGPAEMPYSEAFLPSLQGWIAARQVLYAKAGQHIRSQLRIVSESPAAGLPPSAVHPSKPPSQAVIVHPETPIAPLSADTQHIESPPLPSDPIPISPEASVQTTSTPFPEKIPTEPSNTESFTRVETPAQSGFISQPQAIQPPPEIAQDEPPHKPTPLEPFIHPPLIFSPLGISSILQVELPSKGGGGPTLSIATSSSSMLETQPTSPEPQLISSDSSAETSFASAQEMSFLSEELREKFHRPYIPLDSPTAPIHLPSNISEDSSPPSTSAEHIELPPVTSGQSEPYSTEGEQLLSPPSDFDELKEKFHRPYIPLEITSGSIHLPSHLPDSPSSYTESSSTESILAPESVSPAVHETSFASPPQTSSTFQSSSPPPISQDIDLFKSESPIRVFIPLDINPEASIHLPIPEPESNDSPSFSVPLTENQSSPTPDFKPKSTWESFLEELQKELPLSESKGLSVTKELENLRHEFIRRLLARRIVQPHSSPPIQEENLIDKLINKLSTFQAQAAPPTERELPELSIPNWETSSKGPLIYTETMARLYWSQGDTLRAIEIYEVLTQKHPEKAGHYRRQIERIQAGEMP